MSTKIQELTNTQLSDLYYNISLVDFWCKQEDPITCEEVTNVFGIDKPGQPGNLIYDFKYLLDLDGEWVVAIRSHVVGRSSSTRAGGGWSIRFLHLMWSNALVFKSTLYHEWSECLPVTTS
jgi:hypothetical protein